jgi:hypothetical protein
MYSLSYIEVVIGHCEHNFVYVCVKLYKNNQAVAQIQAALDKDNRASPPIPVIFIESVIFMQTVTYDLYAGHNCSVARDIVTLHACEYMYMYVRTTDRRSVRRTVSPQIPVIY